MSLDALPPEIISLISGHIHSMTDLFCFLRANHKLYNILIGELYQKNIRSDGGSALVWFASHGNEKGVQCMLAAGADVNVRSLGREQPTGLLEAISHNHICIVQLLLENGASPDVADLRSRRPLTLATSGRSDIAITNMLLHYGAKINSVAFDKRSPLLESIRSNQASKAALLLKHGADAHILERNGMNLLHVAASKNATSAVVKALLDSGIDVDSQDHTGRTPLQVATEHSCLRAVQVLLQHGANPNFQNHHRFGNGWTPIFYATRPKIPRNDNRTIIRTLVTHGAEIDMRDSRQQTPLLYAISRGHIQQAQIFLQSGANIMAQNSDGEGVLHLAALSPFSSLDMINWLAENGADVNWVGGKQRETPVFYAIKRIFGNEDNEPAEIQKLLSLGADVNFRNIDGLSPLDFAVRKCSISVTKILLDRGAQVNSRNLQGKAAIHHVFDAGFLSPLEVQEMAALLIRHGADVNARDSAGYTPLHIAVTERWTWELVGELLKAGADRCAMSEDGKFPYDMIPDGPWAETQRLFLRHYPV